MLYQRLNKLQAQLNVQQEHVCTVQLHFQVAELHLSSFDADGIASTGSCLTYLI